MVTQVITYPRTVISVAHQGELPSAATFFSTSGTVVAKIYVVNLDKGESE